LSRATGKKEKVGFCLLLALVTLTVYSSANFLPFVSYDDDGYVTNNLHVRAGLHWNTLPWALTTTEADNWHPLTWLSHALDCQLYGLNPTGHHFTNVLLHVMNVVLFFLLLDRFTGARWRSFLVAALFALHPINVESVAWTAERKNVLSTLFFLLALGAYGRYTQLPRLTRYLVVVILFVLGLAAKPMVITLPFVLLLLDVWPLQRIQEWGKKTLPSPLKGGRKRREQLPATAPENSENAHSIRPAPFWRLVAEKLPLLIFCAGSAVITIVAQRTNSIRTLERFPLGVRLENAIYACADYVWKAFWPMHLAAFYPHPGDTLPIWLLGLAVLFLTAVTLLVWKQGFARRYLVTGWLWFLVTLVPVIGLVQVGDQAMADRYAYIPLIGVFVMLVWGVADWADSKQIHAGWRAAAAVVILAVFSFFTWRQIGYWRSDYDLWSHAMQVSPESPVVEENLSKALAVLGRVDEALPGLERAARFNPSDPTRHVNLGSELATAGRLQEAIVEYQKAIEVASGVRVYSGYKDVAVRTTKARSYESLATIYDELGDYTNLRESYREALKTDPAEAPAMIQRMSASATEDPSGASYLQLGILFEEAGRLQEARSAYEQALKVEPSFDPAKQALNALDQHN
jgi:tetratricopeptide (TPR) repeat protein